MEDRRQGDRYLVWFPIRIEGGEGDEQMAMSQNVSRSGMLVATAVQPRVGAEVTVRFAVPPDDEERTARGRVVRLEDNDEDPDGLWPYRMAVTFDETIPELEPVLRASEQRQSWKPRL